MLNRITIMPQKGCKGMSNARIKSYFKATFGEDPTMIRTEGRPYSYRVDGKEGSQV